MKIRFVTRNSHKILEVQSILKDPGVEVVPVDLVIEELQTEDVEKLVRDKVLKAFNKVGKPVFVEQTGLFIKYLNDFPGGLTQIFWDSLKADKFAEIIGGLADSTLIAKTIIGYCDGRKIHFFEGSIEGYVPKAPVGDRNFQWDCVFIANGHKQTFAEMGMEKKNEISMRKKAFDSFRAFLEVRG